MPAASHGPPPSPCYSGYPHPVFTYAYGAITLSGAAFQQSSTLIRQELRGSYNPAGPTALRFGLLPFRSPLLREYLLVSFPPGTEMFHFPGFASLARCPAKQDGLPHSGILGSMPACGSPRLIAACHALHRHEVPRHPPHTFTIVIRISPRCQRV